MLPILTSMKNEEIVAINSKNLLHENYISGIKSELKGEMDMAKRSGDYRKRQACMRAYHLIEAMEYVLKENGLLYS